MCTRRVFFSIVLNITVGRRAGEEMVAAGPALGAGPLCQRPGQPLRLRRLHHDGELYPPGPAQGVGVGVDTAAHGLDESYFAVVRGASGGQRPGAGTGGSQRALSGCAGGRRAHCPCGARQEQAGMRLGGCQRHQTPRRAAGGAGWARRCAARARATQGWGAILRAAGWCDGQLILAGSSRFVVQSFCTARLLCHLRSAVSLSAYLHPVYDHEGLFRGDCAGRERILNTRKE